jgi:hypothetical protein
VAQAALPFARLALQLPSRTPTPRGLGVGIMVLGTATLACALLAGTILALDRRRSRREPRLVQDEWRARRLMDEMCPEGWSATITMFPRGAALPPDAPAVDRPLVCLEWAELEDREGEGPRVVVARRMWGTSIAAALDGMVADRSLDFTLEGIERRAAQ